MKRILCLKFVFLLSPNEVKYYFAVTKREVLRRNWLPQLDLVALTKRLIPNTVSLAYPAYLDWSLLWPKKKTMA
jgi:hypothetical protein